MTLIPWSWDLMGSLRAFEMNLKRRKKEKFNALKLMQEEDDSDDEDKDAELALLTKNFKKFLRKCVSHLNLVHHS